MLENERKIIRQAQKGDAEHFGILYDYYLPQIYRFILLKVSDKTTAEDITHEVFLSAWQNIDNYNDRGHPFSSWLYQIARNRVIDYYRTKKETSPIDNVPDDVFKTTPVIADQLDRRSEFERVKTAISQLGDEQQNIIILRFIEELSPAEIAELTGKSEGAVRLMQHRAIQKLRGILNE